MRQTLFALSLHLIGIMLSTSLSQAQSARDAAKPDVEITALKVNHLESPPGLGNDPLRFSWRLESDARDLSQTAYRVKVRQADAKETSTPLWDSGIVRSDRSINIPYGGPPLSSRGRYRWQVELWSNKSAAQSTTSEPARFEMGLLNKDDWTARWIGAQAESESPEPRPAPLFRQAFDVTKKIATARAYVTGLGYFQMTLNGKPVSDHVLDPVVTQYDHRVKYLVFDIEDHLRHGENVVGMTLGNGWFNQHSPSAWDFDKAPWRDTPRLIAQIELQYEDGTRSVIASDESWRWKAGPITFNSIRNGDVYDARQEMKGWDEPGFDARSWKPASIVSAPTTKLEPQMMPPARVVNRLDAIRKDPISDTVSVYAFAVNTSGRTVVEASGPPGESIILRYGERLAEDGRLDQKEVARFIRRGPAQTDIYRIGESGQGRFEPLFMYHGFQYVEIERSSPNVTVDSIHANVIHTDLKRTGSFNSSNSLLNELYQVTINTFLTNYHSYPTDCPHREKIGWTGDGQLVMDFGLFNFDSALAYSKWLEDMSDAQRPSGQVPSIVPTSGWGFVHGSRKPPTGPEDYRNGGHGPHWEGVCISLPWRLYLATGDIGLLEKQYPTMKGYYRFLQSWSEDGTLRIGIDDHKWIRLRTEAPVIATAYYYHFSRIMEKAARTLGYENEARAYKKDQNPIKSAFNREFLDENTGIYDNGSQTSQALAIAFDLVPEKSRGKVIDRLIDSIEATDGHPIAGVVGVRALVEALPKIGRSDLLYEMATKRTMPSWGWWLEQGATTLWQNWDGSQSRNHVMFGSINDFFYENLAGIQIDPDHPGYKRFYIKPVIIDNLTHASAWHDSPFGKIRSSWEMRDGKLSLTVEAPPNTSAIVHLPSSARDVILESGRNATESEGVEFVGRENGAAVFRISSGIYVFERLSEPKL